LNQETLVYHNSINQSDCKISSFKAKEFWKNDKNDFSFGAKFLELFYFLGISIPPKYDERENISVVMILQLGFIKKFHNHNIFKNLVCLLCLSTFFLQGGLVLSIFFLGVADWGCHRTFLQ
jgi:hypothetical protein